MLINSVVINLVAALFIFLNILLLRKIKQKYILGILLAPIIYSALRDEGFNQDTYSYNNYIGNALESRMEIAFKYILHYSNSIIEFNMIVAALKSIILLLIVRADKELRLKYFWLYYLLCYQLMFDYTTIRYGLAVFIVIYAIRLYDVNKHIFGGLALVSAPLFHFSTIPAYIYLFRAIKLKHFLYLCLFLLIPLLFVVKGYLADYGLVIDYLLSKSDEYLESPFKIYKSIFDLCFVLYFCIVSGFKNNLKIFSSFILFLFLDVMYPSIGFNRIRILFEILVVIRFSEHISGVKNVMYKTGIFLFFVLSRAILSVYDFLVSSF